MPNLDLFTPVAPADRQNPGFLTLTASRGYAPARAMMQQVMDDMGDRDGNFVQQFQTDGFDARTWELYLYATFAALDFDIDMSHEAPDFVLAGRDTSWAVEATTANPSAGGLDEVPDEPEARAVYLREELPIRLGSPLFSKLGRAYWQLPNVTDRPFVIALQSFATRDSLQFADNAITDLLYGVRTTGRRRPDGTLEVISTPIDYHRGTKTIPSNFFAQPGAEHVSAVLWSNSGTVAKFGRMAFQEGMATSGVTMIRYGTRYVMDPNASEPAIFRYEVGSRWEGWAEGIVVIHNPAAIRPLPLSVLPEALHHELIDGRVVSTIPPFAPFNSFTITIAPVP